MSNAVYAKPYDATEREPVYKCVNTVGDLIAVLRELDEKQPLTLAASWMHGNNYCYVEEDRFDVWQKQKEGQPIGITLIVEEMNDGRIKIHNSDTEAMCAEED